MRKDVNGHSYFTPEDVSPVLYQRVKHTKKANWMDGVIFLAFITGLIAVVFSL